MIWKKSLENQKVTDEVLHKLVLEFVNKCRVKPKRTLKQFVLEEIIIPNGPYKGFQFDFDFQPFAELYFDIIEQDIYTEIDVVGPVQSGKTMTVIGCVLLYVLFELEEDAIYGVPTLEMAGDKWEQDIKKLILSTRYKDLLPAKGAGSRGGTVDKITFLNGVTLKFMPGTGGDENRSGYTCRWIFITEVDKFLKKNRSSDETSPIDQIISRAESFGDKARVFLECTITVKSGHIHQSWKRGGEGNIVNPCPKCKSYILFSREDLKGWKDCESQHEAKKNSFWTCPNCEHKLTEKERKISNKKGKVIFKGQKINKKGKITGKKPASDSCGFRYTAFHNMFVSAGVVGGREWENMYYAEDDTNVTQENKERRLQQFVYVVPYENPFLKEVKLKSVQVRRQQLRLTKGILPPGTIALVQGIDIGKYRCHWVDLALILQDKKLRYHVPNYGVFRPQSDQGTVDEAIYYALHEHNDSVLMNEYALTQQSDLVGYSCVGIDARYETDTVVKFASEFDGFYPTFGFGSSSNQGYTKQYNDPNKATKDIIYIGTGYNLKYVYKYDTEVVNLSSDYWKSKIHQEYLAESEPDAPKLITLFKAPEQEHIDFSRQVVSEIPTTIYHPEKGEIQVFEKVKNDNHYFDALCIARSMADLYMNHLKNEQEVGASSGGWLNEYA